MDALFFQSLGMRAASRSLWRRGDLAACFLESYQHKEKLCMAAVSPSVDYASSSFKEATSKSILPSSYQTTTDYYIILYSKAPIPFASICLLRSIRVVVRNIRVTQRTIRRTLPQWRHWKYRKSAFLPNLPDDIGGDQKGCDGCGRWLVH